LAKGELVVSPPKTQNSVRTLAIPQQAVDLLIVEHKKHPQNPYMFPSPKTGTMYDPDAFRRTHDKILKAIGAEHVRFHDLRRTFATMALQNGVRPENALRDAGPLLGGIHAGYLHERDKGNEEGRRKEDRRLHGRGHVKTRRRRAETCSPALFFPLWTFPDISKVFPQSRTN